jgi:hypothetical protein
MAAKYESYDDGAAKATIAGDHWRFLRFKLGAHEQVVAATGGHGTAAFVSRNELLKAIDKYAKSKAVRGE